MRNFTAQMTSGRNDPTVAFIGMLNSMQRRDDNKLEREKQDRRLAFLDKKDDRRYLERMAKFDANQVRVLARDKMMDKRYQFGLDEAKRIREDNLAGSMYDTSGNIATTGPLEVQDTSKDNIFLDYDAIKENASSIPLIKTQSIDKITEDNNKILTTFNDLEEKYKDEPEKLDFEKLNAIKDFAPETYNKMNTVDIDLPENTGNYLKSIINTPNFLANKIVKYGKEGYNYLTTSEADKIRQAKDNPKTKEEKAAATLAEFNNKVALLRQKKKDNELARESNKNIIQGQENYLYKNFSKYGDKTTIKEVLVLGEKP